jgi:FkbM family methyltransferase
MKTNLGKFEIEYTNRKEYLLIKEEIFGNLIYDFKSSKKNPYIIDVGSHIGLSIIFFKSIFPDSEILGFEPNPTLFEILERNIFTNNLKDVSVEKKAISINENILPFYIDPTEDMWFSNGSLRNGGWTGKEDSTPISVQSTTLIPYLTREVDMLKIDVEGSEGQILENISEKLHLVKKYCR